MRALLVLPLLLVPLAACARPERAPVPTRTAEPRRTTERVPPPPPPSEDQLDRATQGLLERLLVESPGSTYDTAPPAAADDPRPLAWLAEWELGPGPFRAAEREVPPSALRYALAVSLERRLAAGGPVRPAPRASEPDYRLVGRLERLTHLRDRVYLPRGRRYATTDRGRLVFSYRLVEAASGRARCEGSFERDFDLGGLAADELASAEWVLAWEAARLVREDLERCFPGGAPPGAEE